MSSMRLSLAGLERPIQLVEDRGGLGLEPDSAGRGESWRRSPLRGCDSGRERGEQLMHAVARYRAHPCRRPCRLIQGPREADEHAPLGVCTQRSRPRMNGDARVVRGVVGELLVDPQAEADQRRCCCGTLPAAWSASQVG